MNSAAVGPDVYRGTLNESELQRIWVASVREASASSDSLLDWPRLESVVIINSAGSVPVEIFGVQVSKEVDKSMMARKGESCPRSVYQPISFTKQRVEGAMRAVRVCVSGRVQGVFFRASTQAEAESLGLAGWVRNLHDGRVELWAEGEDQAIEDLLLWCHKGPEQAEVIQVDVSEEAPKYQFASFEIRH